MSTETKTQHTPAPWKLATSGYANAPSVIFVGDRRPDFGKRYPLDGIDWIAEVKEDESPRAREYHANARLIAAAPELLEALEALVHAWQDEFGNCICEIDGEERHAPNCPIVRAETAIRKTKGESL